MKRLMVLGLMSAALSGCFEKDPVEDGLTKAVASVKAIEVANNSPDATLKSWWKVKDASSAVISEICKSNQKAASPYFDKLSEMSAPEVVDHGNCLSRGLRFDRQIQKVEVQSETRAVVTARIRNVTPPEEGATLDESDRKAKEAGEPFQYLLERKDAQVGWKITKISSFPSYANDWQDVSEKPKPSNHRYVYGGYQ